MGFSESVIQQLSQPLDADRVAHRQGLSYIEGYDAIDTANRIFGYDGWSMHQTKPVFFGHVGEFGAYVVTATIEVDNASRQDSGMGLIAGRAGETPKAEAHETAMKGAATDAMKRAIRTFGNQFGNSLYDKASPLHNGGNVARPAIPGAAPTFQRPTGNTPAPAPRASNSGGTISAAQVAFIGRLGGTDADATARFGVATLADVPKGSAASAWIDELKADGFKPASNAAPRRTSAPAVDADVPF